MPVLAGKSEEAKLDNDARVIMLDGERATCPQFDLRTCLTLKEDLEPLAIFLSIKRSGLATRVTKCLTDADIAYWRDIQAAVVKEGPSILFVLVHSGSDEELQARLDSITDLSIVAVTGQALCSYLPVVGARPYLLARPPTGESSGSES